MKPLSLLDKQILDLISKGKKLEAVKLYNDSTGYGLKESKDYVEALEEGKTVKPALKISSSDLDKELLNLCSEGNKFAAIKLHYAKTKNGLKESKDYVENLAKAHGITTNKTGCFIATACYGDYNAPEVLVLRNYRDQKLLTTFTGKFLVKLYYYFSPFLAKQLNKSSSAKKWVKNHLLKPMINILEQQKLN